MAQITDREIQLMARLAQDAGLMQMLEASATDYLRQLGDMSDAAMMVPQAAKYRAIVELIKKIRGGAEAQLKQTSNPPLHF
jgi:hypothetical protein